MWELLPKPCGRKQPSPVHAATQGAKSPKRGLITDIALWTKCFTALAAALSALSARYPDKAPHFMAYLRTIVTRTHHYTITDNKKKKQKNKKTAITLHYASEEIHVNKATIPLVQKYSWHPI